MTKLRVRLAGAGMTALACAAFLVVFFLTATEPVSAAACCQECEANELACFGACDALSDPDERSACWDECDGYSPPNGCWAHCIWCTPPDPPESQWYCYQCQITSVQWFPIPFPPYWWPTVSVDCGFVQTSDYCWSQ